MVQDFVNRRYLISFTYILLFVSLVTEKEVKQGLLDIKDANKHCLWFQRTLRGIDKAEPSRLVSRYTGLLY